MTSVPTNAMLNGSTFDAKADETTRHLTRLTGVLGLGGLALLAVTWRLWTPQEVFPRVPLLFALVPRWLDWCSLGLLIAALVTFGLAPFVQHLARARRFIAVAMSVGWGLQFAADQHRLQPWAWQFFLLGLLLILADDGGMIRFWKWLVIGIYAYSALWKFDPEFVRTTGNWLIHETCRLKQPSPMWMAPRSDPGSLEWLPWLLPLGELITAVLLCLPGSRRFGLYASWLMHFTLLGFLGPFGMRHSPGVLLWNVYFLVQNFYLFGSTSQNPPAVSSSLPPPSGNRFRNTAACGILVGALIWPALRPWGWCDDWLAWAVYLPEPVQVKVYVSKSILSCAGGTWDLKQDLQQPWAAFEAPPDVFEADLGRWSLKTLGVPCYPHPRFRTAIAMALATDLRFRTEFLDDGANAEPTIGLIVNDTTHPQQSCVIIATRDDIDELWSYASTFRVNAFPEHIYRDETR